MFKSSQNTPLLDSNSGGTSQRKWQVLALFLGAAVLSSAVYMSTQEPQLTPSGDSTLSLSSDSEQKAQRTILKQIRNRAEPQSLYGTRSSRSPSSCSSNIDILKKGPANIQQVLSSGQKYTDTDFVESDNGISYKRWPETSGFRDNTIFDSGTVHFTEANQGGLGNCYFISSISIVTEWPDEITQMFVTGLDQNDAGIYGIRFFIRGKPWILTIDDKLAFRQQYDGSYSLLGVDSGADSQSMWAPILEKAWAKLKGSTETSGNGGLIQNGLRATMGVPVFGYRVEDIAQSTSAYNEVFDILTNADLAGYPMGFGTVGNSDQDTNDCGIARMHAYSMITAFTMRDSSNREVQMLLMRNPWGKTYYTGDWSENDRRWTSSMISQVPLGIDPTNSADIGIFVMPITTFADTSQDCVADYQIGHQRNGEGYTNTWLDVDDESNNEMWSGYAAAGENGADDETKQEFTITVPRNSGDLYFTAESYLNGMVPEECQGAYGAPLLLVELYNGYNRLDYKYYPDMLNMPLMVEEGSYSGGTTFTLKVQYKWFINPVRDYTVGVYSSQDLEIKDSRGQSNFYHMDGQSPSGFTQSSFSGISGYDTAGEDEVPYSVAAETEIPVAAMIQELRDVYSNYRASRLQFSGFDIREATNLLLEKIEEYDKEDYITYSEVYQIVNDADTRRNFKITKKEFLNSGRAVAEFINQQL